MTEQAVGGMAPIRASAKVVQVQGWIREYVGEGAKINLEWDRSGGQTLELIGGDRSQWSTQNLFGRMGTFRMSAPGSRLFVDDPEIRYEVRGADIALDLHCLCKGLAARLTPADPTAVGASGGPVGFGISGLMTVFSVLSFIWQLIHPTITLTLPGSVGLQALLVGDVLTLDLQRPLPTLKIHVGLTFTPSLSRVIVTPSKLRFEFEGSSIKEREVAIV